MGFSGGGSNILKPHTHNGLTVQDGGALDFNDITQSQSSAGMVFYSDGTHLQQLAYPGSPAGETLTAAAASSAPTWAAGGGGGGYSHVETFTATASSTFTCTLASALATSDFISILGVWRGKWNASGADAALELQIATDLNQPITASHYSWAGNILGSSSTFTNGVDVDNFTVGASTDSDASRGSIFFELTVNPAIGSTTYPAIFLRWWQVGNNVQQSWCSGFVYESSAITDIEGFHFTNSAGNNIDAGTTLDIFKTTSS